jgi:phosphoribosylformylglycinamidine synthase
MMFEVTVGVALKEQVLDPAGQSTAHVLQHMGYDVDNLRIGKQIRFQLKAEDFAAAEAQAREMAQKLLANPVMEQYTVAVVSA